MHGELLNDSASDRAFCRRLLPGVSRTFALTIRLLPPGLEYPVLVAYLLCRVADTIEDSTTLPAAEKVRLLGHFRACLAEGGPDAGPLRAAFPGPSDEELLARESDRVLREYRALGAGQRAAIRPWVQEMCEGMASFVGAGGSEGSGRLHMLASVEDLERYCYYVAGTVGHLLTALFRLHDRAMSEDRYQRLDALATGFGLGLQMTNIVKDVADDRNRGVSFVPRELFETTGVRPEDLEESGQGAARRVMEPLIARARRHLESALEYCTTLPRGQYRIRLFCLTSLYFAARTLRLARRDPSLLGGARKLKITRGAVYRTLAMTYLVAPVDALVRAYFVRLEGQGS